MALTKGHVNRAGETLAAWWVGTVELTEDELPRYLTVISDWRDEHQYPLALTMPGLRNWVDRAGGATRPAQRLKQMQTIIEKLVRHPGMKLARMQDIAGCRAVLQSRAQVDEVAARIQDRWNVVRLADYRDRAREDTGYRALHLMIEKRDRIVEVQLRTETEHRWAEVVASTGSRLNYPLKDGGGPPALVEYFKLASTILWLADQGLAADEQMRVRFTEVREAVRPFFEN